MRKKLLIIALFCAILAILPACGMKAEGSVKTLTKPYIAVYECVEARLGEQNLLDGHDYIRITLLDSKEFEVSYKPTDGQKKSFKGEYKVDPETRILTGEIGILGFGFKESVSIENGKFTIIKTFLSKPLIMKFEAI